MRTRRNNWGAYASVFGLAGTCLAMGACSDQTVGGEEVGSHSDGVIIGTNDLVVVSAGGANVPAKYRPFVNAFGRLHMASGLCTATHLGNGIAISAGHCWSAGATRQNDTTCPSSYVEWGYIGGTSASRSDCTTVLAKQQSSGTNRLDYAIFRVSPIPPDFVPVDFSAKAPSGATLTIFSHPGGRPLEWSTTCTVQSPGTTQLSYQCDTEGGSSGATVLEDDSLKVTGIHWGGGGSANSATYILATPIGEFLQPDGGGTGGTGGAGGGDGGKADAADGKAGSGGADGSTGDGATDGSSDAPQDGTGDGAAGSAGAAGAAGASGAGGTAGASGAGGAAGKAGAAGTGGGGTGGTGGAGGKAGGAGTGGSTGGGSGAGGSGGATGGAGGAGGSAGGSAGSSSGGKGGTGGSGTTGGSAGTGGTTDDGGCSCRIVPASQGSEGGEQLRGLLAALAIGLVGSLRRARRKSTPSSS